MPSKTAAPAHLPEHTVPRDSEAAGARYRILLVDPDPDNVELARLLLEQIPGTAYELVWAADPARGAALAESPGVDACLVDFQSAGQEMLGHIERLAGGGPALPVILIGNGISHSDLVRAMEAGATDYVRRPDLTWESLDRTLRYAVTRHRYRLELWRSREHYRRIVDASLNAIIAIDAESIITEWNPEAARMFGWSRDEALGRRMRDLLIPSRSLQLFEHDLEELRRRGPAAETARFYERRLLKRDGSEIPVNLNIVQVADEHGPVLVVFFEDLTEVKERIEATRRYERIVQSTTDFIALLDRDLRYLAVNDSYAAAFGRPVEQIVGSSVWEVFGAKLVDALFLEHYRRCLDGEEVAFEAWIPQPDQGRRYMSVHYDPYRDDTGRVTGIVEYARDITDRKQAEEQLDRNHRLISTVLELQSGFIGEIDRTDLFRDLLNRVLALTGSTFGFIGEALQDRNGAPFLKTYAIIDAAAGQEDPGLSRLAEEEGVEFRNLDSLFGLTLTSGQPVISNDPDRDPRSAVLSPLLPLVHSFLGLPFRLGGRVVGIACIANRPGGYDEAIVRYLEPVTNACAAIIGSWRSEQRRQLAEQRFRQLYDENPAMFFTLDRDGNVLSTNEYAAEVLGYDQSEIVGHPVGRFFHAEDADLARQAMAEAFASPAAVRSWELRKQRSDGTTLWVRETARVSTAPDGQEVLLVVCEDISGARALSERLTYQATHDALTDLVNRREFERRLGEALNDARQTGSEHAMCFVDLDQFKVVNDTCGHVAGDALLRELAGILGGRIRRRDTLARLGGDEFGVLMEDCSLPQARQLAVNLHRIISDHRFTWEGRYFSVGASIGVVPITRHSSDVYEVLRLADAACYAAKDSGRNTIHVYDDADELVERRHGEMLWVERINRALEHGHMRLACQPIVPVTDPGNEGHYEILVRLSGDDGQLIPPGAFLPAAERYGVIGRIDRWVVSSWFDWLGANPVVRDRLRMSSINLSGHSISDPELLKFIDSAASRNRIPRERICFELTETSAIANLSAAVEFMDALRQSGFRFALDDFGSGLSSFAYLRTLPVNYVKIDGVFVKDIARNEIDRALVRSINDVAHTMGKQTIAEFVEDDEALRVLGEIGVDFAQGYGIGRPRPVDSLAGRDCGAAWHPGQAKT